MVSNDVKAYSRDRTWTSHELAMKQSSQTEKILLMLQKAESRCPHMLSSLGLSLIHCLSHCILFSHLFLAPLYILSSLCFSLSLSSHVCHFQFSPTGFITYNTWLPPPSLCHPPSIIADTFNPRVCVCAGGHTNIHNPMRTASSSSTATHLNTQPCLHCLN